MRKKYNSGFTLIEALVVLFIFSLVTSTFYSVFSLGSSYIIESKNRLGAISLANEKMEIIRNLKYDAIGIAGGIPSGNITAEEDVIESKRAYHVKTFIKYFDDPFDGTGPTEADYKWVRVTISWTGPKGADSDFSLVSRFVPPGIEQNLAGGVLSINIIGSDGIGVPQASVHITNTDLSPAVNLTAMTDNTGNLMLPGARQSIQKYNITVTKTGYETVNTIDPNSVVYSVTDTPASVVDGMLNMKSIVQDKLADLKITASDYLGAPLADVNFSLEGGRILGFDMFYSPAKPTYNLTSDKTTNANGEVNLDNISPGQYFVSNISAAAGYTLIGLDTFSGVDQADKKYTLLTAPGDASETNIKFAKNSDDSLLISVVRASDDSSVLGADVTLTNASGYSENQKTLADGVAFFPVSTVPLETGAYDLRVTADGFNDYTATIDINQLVTQQIKLIAI